MSIAPQPVSHKYTFKNINELIILIYKLEVDLVTITCALDIKCNCYLT